MDGLRPGVLLDLDGTLVDTNYLHALAWSRGLIDVGEWAPMHAIHRRVGMGGDRLVRELVGHEVAGASDAWHRHYRLLRQEARLFPGARDLVLRLHAEGLVVVLASSSPKEEVELVVDLLDAGDAIGAVTTADDVDEAKPAADVVEAALRAGSVDPALALVVGDTVWDVRSARAAGVGCIGVESGGFSRHELTEDGALEVYRDVAELLAQLRTSAVALLLRQR
jgi:HAD superfamily hydrolase (TIGR01509 family)